MERYLSVGQPSRLLVRYNNIDTLNLKIFKVARQSMKALSRNSADSSRFNTAKTTSPISSWQAVLRNEHDYHSHSTELVMPELPQGCYLMMVSPDSLKYYAKDTYAYQVFQVSNLGLITGKDQEKGDYFQAVNRITGQPLSNANIRLKNKNTTKYNLPFDKTLRTDKMGLVFPNYSRQVHSLEATITSYNDTLTTADYRFYRNNRSPDRKEYVRAKPFIFTDRSIYRPGQKVYFKGILVKQVGNKSDIVANEYVEVYLDDVNGDEVGKMRLKSNEYGSFSGEFKLPLSGITGEYTLYAEEDYEEDSHFYDEELDDFLDNPTTISVEEYKRPKFEVKFDKVEESFRLNDTIHINGEAISFSESTINHAKVAYTVKRMVRYPRWYYRRSYRYHSSSSQEITHGETVTDASGQFSIDFKALPDLLVEKDGQPVFEYEVNADVTDINGETRSNTTIVKVGYHTLSLAVELPDQIKRNVKGNSLSITTKNLNGSPVDAQGKVYIYYQVPPQTPKRSRPWKTPDYQMISEREFATLFPYDHYNNQEDSEDNKKLIVEYNFNTARSSQVPLINYKKWNTGRYLVIVQCKDDFEQEVISRSQFELIDSKKRIPNPGDIFTVNLDKEIYDTGEEVIVTLASPIEVYVTIEIEKGNIVIDRLVEHVNNEVKEIRVPVSEDDGNGFAIRYHYVRYNEWKSSYKVVRVKPEGSRLNIVTNTFRDKLQPGDSETWSFKISGEGKDRAMAEVLTSMYDASLDQFKSHSWSFSPYQRYPYYVYPQISGRQSFGTINFNIRNLRSRYLGIIGQQFDQLDWFGFNLDNFKYANRRYLERIRYATYSSKTSKRKDEQLPAGVVIGTVIDHLGEPMPGVNIVVVGTAIGTVTDLNGDYQLNVENGKELEVAFIGYRTERTTIGGKNIINFKLETSSHELSEIVITAEGISEERKSLGYSVTSTEEVLHYTDSDFRSLLQGKVAGVSIVQDSVPNANVLVRGNNSISAKDKPLYVVDGRILESFELPQNELLSVNVLKGKAATSLYGSQASNGVVIINTRSGQAKIERELAQVQTRQNLNETAFFFPHLKTDDKGNTEFSFTTPEALTRWNLQILAHTKDLRYGLKTLQTITQKELMVVPNPPRFLRQGDKIAFAAKVVNLSGEKLNGAVALQLFDAFTGNPVDVTLGNVAKNQTFEVEAKGSQNITWQLSIPENIQAIRYKVVASAGNFSDGEQSILPVLTNRLLVTETLPMSVKSNQTKTYNLDKLGNHKSSTLKHHRLTLEVTSNPVWYAVQALPYLMEFPHECAEQTFARYYSNTLASHVINSNPKIKKVFDQWKSNSALISNLEKNPELKSIIINETPWLRDAQNEAEQKQRLALLFDLNQLRSNQDIIIDKLEQMQLSNGGFPWFSGGYFANRFITQHIITGFGHLMHLGVNNDNDKLTKIVENGIRFLDNELVRDYNRLLEEAASESKSHLDKKHLSPRQIQFIYMRSFFKEHSISPELNAAMAYYLKQSKVYWKEYSLYMRGMIALIQARNGDEKLAGSIVRSLWQNSITNEELGMYWKENKASWWWYESPIETQALMIEVFSEISMPTKSEVENQDIIDNLKLWLLKHKQTNAWSTTKSTTEAIYALLLKGTDWLSIDEQLKIKVGNQAIDPSQNQSIKAEAGTGYFKTSWKGEEITTEMAKVEIVKQDKGIAWGSLYWQYFEDLDKITPASTPLQLEKKLFLKRNTDAGEELVEIDGSTSLVLGDLITVRIVLKVDRDIDFVHMKDMRASGLEPINVMSEYKWQDGLGYYESTRDASTNFFFESLTKGVYVFEYDLRVNNKGDFSNGITTIQSMYAPEFSSHSEGVRIKVD
ncbi:MAG: MG2 domain-containing protein [Bacteroidota bacterium]